MVLGHGEIQENQNTHFVKHIDILTNSESQTVSVSHFVHRKREIGGSPLRRANSVRHYHLSLSHIREEVQLCSEFLQRDGSEDILANMVLITIPTVTTR
jgi:hypothetical protein